MIYFNHQIVVVRKNAFYSVSMNHPNGNKKQFNVLGEGLEGLVTANERAGYYINSVEMSA